MSRTVSVSVSVPVPEPVLRLTVDPKLANYRDNRPVFSLVIVFPKSKEKLKKYVSNLSAELGLPDELPKYFADHFRLHLFPHPKFYHHVGKSVSLRIDAIVWDGTGLSARVKLSERVRDARLTPLLTLYELPAFREIQIPVPDLHVAGLVAIAYEGNAISLPEIRGANTEKMRSAELTLQTPRTSLKPKKNRRLGVITKSKGGVPRKRKSEPKTKEREPRNQNEPKLEPGPRPELRPGPGPGLGPGPGPGPGLEPGPGRRPGLEPGPRPELELDPDTKTETDTEPETEPETETEPEPETETETESQAVIPEARPSEAEMSCTQNRMFRSGLMIIKLKSGRNARAVPGSDSQERQRQRPRRIKDLSGAVVPGSPNMPSNSGEATATATTTQSKLEIHVGPKGGKYFWNNGKKNYLPK
ncbi:MAG: hypothetical protein ACYCOU_05215 [Sulfobacillus sp.]